MAAIRSGVATTTYSSAMRTITAGQLPDSRRMANASQGAAASSRMSASSRCRLRRTIIPRYAGTGDGSGAAAPLPGARPARRDCNLSPRGAAAIPGARSNRSCADASALCARLRCMRGSDTFVGAARHRGRAFDPSLGRQTRLTHASLRGSRSHPSLRAAHERPRTGVRRRRVRVELAVVGRAEPRSLRDRGREPARPRRSHAGGGERDGGPAPRPPCDRRRCRRPRRRVDADVRRLRVADPVPRRAAGLPGQRGPFGQPRSRDGALGTSRRRRAGVPLPRALDRGAPLRPARRSRADRCPVRGVRRRRSSRTPPSPSARRTSGGRPRRPPTTRS